MSKAEIERARRDREGLPRKRRRWPRGLVALIVAAGAGYYVCQGTVIGRSN